MAGHYDRVLLTVGNDTYHPCGRQRCQSKVLQGAVNDSIHLDDYCRKNDWLVFSGQNVQSKTELLSLARQANCRISPKSKIVVFHYSGHSRSRDGELELLMCGDDTDVSQMERCHCARGSSQEGWVNLHDFLKQLCRKIQRRTKVLVLIDGCRTENNERLERELAQTNGLRDVQLLIMYACGRGRSAHEVQQNGCWHGSFTLAFLTSMEQCETLAELVDEAQSGTSGRPGLFGSQECSRSIQGGWADYSSVPNFFKAQNYSAMEAEANRRAAGKLRDAVAKNSDLVSKVERLEKESKECKMKEDEKTAKNLHLVLEVERLENKCRMKEDEKTANELQCNETIQELQEEIARLQEDNLLLSDFCKDCKHQYELVKMYKKAKICLLSSARRFLKSPAPSAWWNGAWNWAVGGFRRFTG